MLDGRLDEAETKLRDALARLEQGAFRAEVAATHVSLGELARARGDLRLARTEYAAALGQARAYGLVQDSVIALLDLAITELAMGRPERAARRLAAVDGLGGAVSPRWQPYVETVAVAVAAGCGHWERAEGLAEGLFDLGESLPADADVVELLERAASTSRLAGQAVLAGDLADLALSAADRSGDDESAQRIRRIMQDLSGSAS